MSDEKNQQANNFPKIETQDFGLDNQRKTEILEKKNLASDFSKLEVGVNSPEDIAAATDLKPVETEPPKKARFKAVRTYRDYAAEKLQGGGASLTQMILKERDREREEQRNSVKNTKNILIVGLSLIVVLVGVAAIIGAFYYLAETQDKQQRVSAVIIPPDPLIFTDFKKEVYASSYSRNSLINNIRDAVEETSIPVGLVREIILTKDNERKTAKVILTTQDLLQTLEVDIEPRFYRTADDQFMMGIYSSTNNSPFLVFKVSSYSSAYADMLSWERFMAQNLASLFGKNAQEFGRSNFSDIVLFNKDVRAILDSSGEVVFGYSFVDQETLLIFENKLALREIITRMINNKLRE